jgi:UDP-N-acetylmuramoyl-tripeptide--D-alanyl-D-alanine ligase
MKAVIKSIVVSILTWEAKLVLKKYNPKIVAVTGSVGKTSTKDAIFTVLSHFFFTRKSQKSFNSELGVPLTILACPTGWNNPFVWLKNIYEGLALILLPNHYPKWLVLEIGADRPGDIEKITKWLKPDVVVITRISKVPVHVEFFPSPEDIIREKSFLVSALKRDGVLILNGDDEDVRGFGALIEATTFFYGLKNADVFASNYQILYENEKPIGISFDVVDQDKSEKVLILGGLGLQQVYPALAGFAVGLSLGFDLKKIAEGFKKHRAPSGRMKIIDGVKNTTIIDDTYNSSPIALNEALNTLKIIKTKGRKIAVLGDMLELGAYSLEEHRKAGEHVAKVAKILITVGIRSRAIAESALNNGMPESNIFQFDNSRQAGIELQGMLHGGDVVLIKGSQGVRMEKTVEEVMANPSEKDKLLVRQESEWQKH